MKKCPFLCSLFLLCLIATPILSQVDYSTATLKGTVFDPQEKWISGATITIHNSSTGFIKSVSTGSDGMYQIPLLQPGSYELKAQAHGFASRVLNVTLSIGQTASYDFHLELGSMSETVEVTAEGELVQTNQTQQANTIGIEVIADLPNVSRSFTDSIFTLPGVSRSEAPRAQNPGFSGFQSSGFSIGGSNGRNNLVTLDGGEGDYGSGQLRTPHVPLESIQEFQVNRSSFAAEFGFTTGTAINLVTKSGTNNYHGNIYAFFRNHATDAANYFAPKIKAFEQSFVPGVTLGGPIAKNKLFFFTAFEYTKQDTPQFRSYSTSAAVKGIASNDAQQRYANGLLTSGSPVLQAIGGQLQYYLTPSNFPLVSALLDPNTGTFNDWKKFKNWVTRLDYQPNENNTVTARFSLMDDDASRMYILDPLNSPDDNTIQYWRDYTLLGSWNHVFKSDLVNQLRIQIVPSDTADVHVAAPDSTYLRLGSLGNFRGEHYEPYYCRQRRFQFEDSVTLMEGPHTFKFGGSYRPVSYYVHDELWFGGDFQFYDGTVPIVGGVIQPGSPAFTALVTYNLTHGLPATGDAATNLSAVQSYSLGIPVAFRQGYGNPNWNDWGHYTGFYGQDSWKLRPNITLDYGVRVDYDAEPAPLPHHTFFSPRLGIAWNPRGDGKTVIRAGGGMFVAPVNFFIDYIVNLLDDSGRYITQVAANLSAMDPTIVHLWSLGVHNGKLPFGKLTESDLQSVGLTVGPGQPGRIVLEPSPNYMNTYSIQGSLSVQRQVTSKMSVDLAYHMYRGLHLQLARDGNVKETGITDPFIGPIYTQIDPTIVQKEVYSSIGNSIYHGITASWVRRSTKLQGQVNYTFSRTIDDATDFNNEFMPFRPTRMDLERGLSAFNVKHNLVANAVYYSPFKAGAGNPLLRSLADITLSPIVSLRSGIPFTVRVPGMQNGTLGQSLYARPWHAGRNTGIGPGFFTVDLRLTKALYLRRDAGVRVEVVVEGTNVLNHTNFSSVNDVFPADPNPFELGPYTVNLLNGPYDFQGQRTLDRSQPLGFKSAFDPRQVQFGLKFVF